MADDTINIAVDFNRYPSGRFERLGTQASGEAFRERVLEPRFLNARNAGRTLKVVLDGVFGLPPSFLDESFGELARKYGPQAVEAVLVIESRTRSKWIDRVWKYVRNPYARDSDVE